MTADESLARISRQLDELNSPDRPGSWVSDSSGFRLWIACLAPTLPLLFVYVYQSVLTPGLAFMPLAVVLVALLYRWRADSSIGRPRTKMGWVPIGFGFLSVLIAVLLSYPWFSALGFVWIAGSMLHCVRGKLRRSLVHLTAPLVGILIPPFQIDDVLTGWAYRKAAWIASIFLDLLEIPHSINGSVIQLFELDVMVSEICGGFLSIYFMLFIAYACMAWKRASLWLLPIYAGAGILTAILIDAIRITFQVFSIDSLDINPVTSWLPPATTLVAMLVAFAILYSFHHLISVIFHYVEANQDAELNPLVFGFNKVAYLNDNRAFEEVSHMRSRESRRDVVPLAGAAWHGLVGVGCLLLLLSFIQAFRTSVMTEETVAAANLLLIPNDNFFADVNLPGVKIINHDSTTSEQGKGNELRSDAWEGTFGNSSMKIQITQPLVGWWELTNGYENVGWEILDRDTVSSGVLNANGAGSEVGAGSHAKPFVYARLRQREPKELQSYLFFSSVGEKGIIGAAPTGFESFLKRLRRRMGLSNDDPPVAMIQLYIVSENRLSPTEIGEVRGAFVKYRETLSDAVASTKKHAGLLNQLEIDHAKTNVSPKSSTEANQ